jgi:TRAP-type C4-dicarboxylate transport system substrate-binding protein
MAVAAVAAGGPALAQQKLKWAHVYETSEPYHTESVWAAAEIKKRTNGKFDIEVFPPRRSARRPTSTRDSRSGPWT